MGSIPVGSTKKQTQTCLLLLSRLEIEGRRSVVPIPVRSAGSLMHGSTKTTVKTVVFYFQRRIERLLTQPDSRTLGRLAAIREYQKADTGVSAFIIPPKNRTAVDTARFPYARQARCYTGVPK